MVPSARPMLVSQKFLWTTAITLAVMFTEAQQEPQLDGQHFRITVLQGGTFLDISEKDDGSLSFSGYLIDMLKEVASKANFSYKLLTPSGFGSQCNPRLLINETQVNEAYSAQYHMQYNCGTNDVNDLQGSNYSTDFYFGMFYISPERQLKNYFTIPFQPPFKGTPAMYGTATGIPTILELVQQQAQGTQPPACTLGSTAIMDLVQNRFPDLAIQPFYGSSDQDIYQSMVTGECPIHFTAAPHAAQFVLRRFESGECLAAGKPIGLIGEPMSSGLSQYAMGVGKHLNRTVVDTLSYWINVLMMDGTLASLYQGQGGTGKECGYVLFPRETEDSRLNGAAITGVVLGAVAAVVILLYVWHLYKLKKQQRRYKKRFVQQIARNIVIGHRPGCIPPGKISEQILHIGQGKEFITKDDLAKWIHDIKLNFISKKDFDALWNAMDIEGKGVVDAVEFIVFLSACGPEFEEVYEEQEKLPKNERLKLAARRLSNIASVGEEGVRRCEMNLDRSSRGFGTSSSPM